MDDTRKLWLALASLLIISFAVLLLAGEQIFRAAPPMPERVVTTQGDVIYTRADIERGRQVWQSIGGMQLGSIWGHGAYVAPDWSADWLHREALHVLDAWAARGGASGSYTQLSPQEQAALQGRLQVMMRANTYDAARGTITVDQDRANAMAAVAAHYVSLFGNDPETAALREAYAMRNDTVADPALRQALTAFVWWTAWAATTERPAAEGETLVPKEPGVAPKKVTYTNNWPSEPLVGNTPPPALWVWSAFSILFLIAGIGILGWHHAVTHGRDDDRGHTIPVADPFALLRITPSMRATAKYFWVVLALFLLQILLGAITAHYQVEGQEAYGFALAEVLPYTVTRTWHTQLAVLWIATAWLATGLYIAPALSGHEPKFQRFGVNFLFVSLLVIVVGSFAGQWLAVMQKLGLESNFWFGHQGWEYADMGRFWQWYLFIGLLLWVFLVGRAIWPVIRTPGESRSIVALLFLATAAIGLFFASALMWGEHTHISEVEYWRWWLVHLWVEGFFEVFATAVMALIFTRLGLVKTSTATVAVLFATIIFMAGGVLGTLHHLYFVGTPISVVALGASFSALEVVPLAYIGFEAYHTYKLSHATPWMGRYRWPLMFFIAVSFWNLVGAGLFGFLINPPLSLYFMQGLNLTPLHGHTALFGVYGMLGIALVLFCLRGLRGQMVWDSAPLKLAFWSLNIGLALMALLTLLPIGTLQLLAAIEHGYAYARSAEFMQQPIIDTLVWMRMPGDIVFSVGAVALTWFVFRLWVAPRREAVSGGETERADR
jgi:Nitric oxide reductase large subunit